MENKVYVIQMSDSSSVQVFDTLSDAISGLNVLASLDEEIYREEFVDTDEATCQQVYTVICKRPVGYGISDIIVYKIREAWRQKLTL
jgi:hypothetical protein